MKRGERGTGEDGSVSLAALVSHLLADQFKAYRLRLLVGFLALISVDFLQLSIPLILRQGIDSLTGRSATTSQLVSLALLIIAIALVVVVLRFIWRMMIIGFSRYLERALRNRIFSHILGMDQHFFTTHSTGDIMAHGSNDLAAVQMACGMGMVAAVDALVVSIVAIGFMIYIHPTLTLMALLPMPLLAISTRILSARLHHRFNHVQEQFSVLTEFARSAMISVKLIKAYTLEKRQIQALDRIGKTYVKANIRVALIQGLLFPAATLIGNLGLLIILIFGGRLVIQGSISMGDFVAFITYLQMLIWPMMAIGWVANLTQRGLTALRRIYRLVTAEPILADTAVSSAADKTQPVIRADRLCFSYPGSTSAQLDNISFSADSGIIGIAGRTGSGKTTLCRLLVRLYPVGNGSLYFHGTDVNHLSLDQVRSQIAYVGQEVILFSDTISANICLGVDDISIEDIEQCAMDADIHDEIMGFGDGYQTIIGERGVTLSGGQRQRIALARALLCERPILVIDDGLSAVDTSTEAHILSALRRRFVGKTVFIVSNRIKLLSMTDQILLLDQGKLLERATHDQLLQKNEFYRTMYQKQMKDSLRAGYA